MTVMRWIMDDPKRFFTVFAMVMGPMFLISLGLAYVLLKEVEKEERKKKGTTTDAL